MFIYKYTKCHRYFVLYEILRIFSASGSKPKEYEYIHIISKEYEYIHIIQKKYESTRSMSIYFLTNKEYARILLLLNKLYTGPGKLLVYQKEHTLFFMSVQENTHGRQYVQLISNKWHAYILHNLQLITSMSPDLVVTRLQLVSGQPKSIITTAELLSVINSEIATSMCHSNHSRALIHTSCEGLLCTVI